MKVVVNLHCFFSAAPSCSSVTCFLSLILLRGVRVRDAWRRNLAVCFCTMVKANWFSGLVLQKVDILLSSEEVMSVCLDDFFFSFNMLSSLSSKDFISGVLLALLFIYLEASDLYWLEILRHFFLWPLCSAWLKTTSYSMFWKNIFPFISFNIRR